MYKSPLRWILSPFDITTFVAFLIIYSEVAPFAEVPLCDRAAAGRCLCM